MRLEFSRSFNIRVWPQRCALALVAAILPSAIAQGAAVTQKEALPILEKNCFQCHGESLKAANLDLRSREAMLKGGDKGPAVIPGKSTESPIYRRVAGLAQPKMPMAP